MPQSSRFRALARVCLVLTAPATAAVVFSGDGLGAGEPAATTEVVVTLNSPSLASFGRTLQSSSHAAYRQRMRAAQDTLARRVLSTLPSARIRWRYSIVANGFAVVVPHSQLDELAAVPGVARVWPNIRYHALRTVGGPEQIGADKLWGASFATAGNGMKIGIIDDGLQATHPYFNPAGFAYPAGFPKGQTQFTTPKVIVQRTFAPPSPSYANANTPFDPKQSFHATHVAGIAAGNHGTNAGGTAISGVAPNAYLGNYKALTIPTPDFGLDGNSAEIAAAIDAAVSDGMDVINLSLGEPEIEQSRDIVVKAIDGAALAGVIPCIAAGNDGDAEGKGSVGSPGSAPLAITAAASTTGRGQAPDILAGFSSIGPAPYSLQLKPDVTAPGVSVVSSVPAREGTWAAFSGTSMASPHVAGAAALLKERHPSWTVAQIKSALMMTGDPAYVDNARSTEGTPLNEGGGRINLARANAPLVFAAPSSLSFGLLKTGQSKKISLALSDAGGGAGTWTVKTGQAAVTAPASVTVPGTLDVTATVTSAEAEGDIAGFVVLTRGADVRRIPYWLHVERPKLGKPTRTLTRAGNYSGDARKGRAAVSYYRYPEGVNQTPLNGPEQVFGLRIARPVSNFGVRVVSQGKGVRVTPRVVRDNDENRLTGYVGLPGDLNPYRDQISRPVPAAGAILPSAGTYSLVFDTPSRAAAGKFTFRVWINDTAPPRVKVKSFARGVLTLAVTDAGSGVDPTALRGWVDGTNRTVRFAKNQVTMRLGALSAGKHTVELLAADYQEAKNMEDVGPILPNTRDFTGSFTVR
jgi:subtilisin family serine protease